MIRDAVCGLPTGHTALPQDTLAMLRLNLSSVPLSDQERADLIRWLRTIADEYAAGEHWGASTLALLKART